MVALNLLGCSSPTLAMCISVPTLMPILLLLMDSPQLIPANRPGLAVARWRVKSRTDVLHLEVYQEALVDSGLLEKIVLSVLLFRSGRAFGDLITKLLLNSFTPARTRY